MVRRGTRGIADVMTQIKKMLLEKSSNDSVMEYISVSSQITQNHLKLIKKFNFLVYGKLERSKLHSTTNDRGDGVLL